MQATGIKPDQIAFGTAVSACAMGGQWERARALLAEMRRSNLRPDVIAYRYTFSGIAHGLFGNHSRTIKQASAAFFFLWHRRRVKVLQLVFSEILPQLRNVNPCYSVKYTS